MVPVSYGVPAYDRIYGSAVLSSDQIAPWLAINLGARRMIEICDVGGIYTGDPHIDKDAKIISRINLENYTEIGKYLSGSSAPADVTGGMRQNYFETLDAAKAGIVCQICHFKSLREALDEKPVGTVIDLNR
jgi:isopentenyl phosphate kinase